MSTGSLKYFTLLFFICSQAIGQKVDYNAIILPKTATDIEYSEKLVQLAWQNSPQSEILNRQVNAANYKVKQVRRNWLDNIKVTGNLNEFNINSISGDPNAQSSFYPRYNVSASLSLGTLFNDPVRTKIEKENLQIAIQNINQQKLLLRADVLSKYQVYLSNLEIFKLRTQMLSDSESDFKLREQSFRRNETSLSEYNIVLDRYNQQKISKVQSEKDLIVSRLELEKLIGMKLTDVQ